MARAAAALLILFGLVLRLGFLGSDSLWLDEAFSVSAVLAHTARETWQTALDPNHPPLYFVILRASVGWLGQSEVAARLPSALASVCNLGLLWMLGKRLGLTPRAARWAVMLLAVAPIDIWYAQEARMYALVTTTGLLFAICLTIESAIGAVLTAVALTLGLYMDFTMIPLSLALTALWGVRWWHLGRVSSRIIGVIGASAIAWLLFYPEWAHLRAVLGRIDTIPLFVNLRQQLGMSLLPGFATGAALVLLVSIVGIGGAIAARVYRRDEVPAWAPWLLLAGYVIVTALAAIPRGYSLKQYLVTGWPFVALVTAWSTSARESGAVTRAFGAALAVSLAAAVATVATPRSDWRSVVTTLNRAGVEGRIVWVDPPWDSIPYDYYRPRIPAVTRPLASPEVLTAAEAAPSDVCLIAERRAALVASAVEIWLDGHLRLVSTTPFARLELRCYAPREPR